MGEDKDIDKVKKRVQRICISHRYIMHVMIKCTEVVKNLTLNKVSNMPL